MYLDAEVFCVSQEDIMLLMHLKGKLSEEYEEGEQLNILYIFKYNRQEFANIVQQVIKGGYI